MEFVGIECSVPFLSFSCPWVMTHLSFLTLIIVSSLFLTWLARLQLFRLFLFACIIVACLCLGLTLFHLNCQIYVHRVLCSFFLLFFLMSTGSEWIPSCFISYASNLWLLPFYFVHRASIYQSSWPYERTSFNFCLYLLFSSFQFSHFLL